MPNRVPATEARRSWADTLNRVAYARERLVLTRHGLAVAALVPLEDLELLECEAPRGMGDLRPKGPRAEIPLCKPRSIEPGAPDPDPDEDIPF